MKLPSLKRDPVSTLASARVKLVEIEAKLAELAAARTAALVESDDDTVREIDDRIVDANRTKALYEDRAAALALAIRAQRVEEAEQARKAAIAVVEQRGAEEIALAAQVERDMRRFAGSFNKLIAWRSRMIRDWDRRLPLPPADAFTDLSGLMHEAGQLYFGLGNPAAGRRSSLPHAIAPSGVRGTEPRGLANYVADAVAAFVARLKRAPVQIPDNDEEIAA